MLGCRFAKVRRIFFAIEARMFFQRLGARCIPPQLLHDDISDWLGDVLRRGDKKPSASPSRDAFAALGLRRLGTLIAGDYPFCPRVRTMGEQLPRSTWVATGGGMGCIKAQRGPKLIGGPLPSTSAVAIATTTSPSHSRARRTSRLIFGRSGRVARPILRGGSRPKKRETIESIGTSANRGGPPRFVSDRFDEPSFTFSDRRGQIVR